MTWSSNLSAPRQPLIKEIEDNKHTVKCQTDQIAKQSVEIQTLQDKINKTNNK